MKRYLLPLLVLASAAMPVHADDTDKAPPVVKVSSVRDPELKSYRTMLKSYSVVEEFKALAPNADFRFLLLPPPGTPAKDLSLRIANADDSVPVPVAKDNSFALPRLPAFETTDAELLLNVKKGGARWRPQVTTPGLPPDTRRLGDLRLECEIRWVVERDELSFARRTLFRTLGGPCGSKNVSTHFITQRPLASATLIDGERRVALAVANGGYTFVPPLHDKTLGNDALVQLVYKDATQ
ncbi:hypothetical protein [Massilia aerilata]|uniref:Molecular chaperone n=1 Tax=Massilia aerilata TaxID=453817 RepID=A0ABW0RXW0_9BURK